MAMMRDALDAQRLNGRQADPAGTEHRRGLARLTLAMLNTEPRPVTTPQAMRHADVSGTSFGNRDGLDLFDHRDLCEGRRGREVAGATPPTVNGSVRFPIDARHHVGLPMLHHLHVPQLATVATTTWSPTLTRVTSEPIRLDDAGAFVTHERRRGPRDGAVDARSRRCGRRRRRRCAPTPRRVRVANLDVVADLRSCPVEHDAAHDSAPFVVVAHRESHIVGARQCRRSARAARGSRIGENQGMETSAPHTAARPDPDSSLGGLARWRPRHRSARPRCTPRRSPCTSTTAPGSGSRSSSWRCSAPSRRRCRCWDAGAPACGSWRWSTPASSRCGFSRSRGRARGGQRGHRYRERGGHDARGRRGHGRGDRACDRGARWPGTCVRSCARCMAGPDGRSPRRRVGRDTGHRDCVRSRPWHCGAR